MAEVLTVIRARSPAADAVVAFLDGDTLLSPGTFADSFAFFRTRPDVGALTTDERAIAEGHGVAREWFDLRFAQRHLYMSSVALSGKVLTLTGRFCAYRASIATDPSFGRIVHDDHLDHWRMGRIRFLTGDDKSTWFWVLRAGWSMLYIPDVRAHTYEALPGRGFLRPTCQLMSRWYGNMLRTNGRALALGPHRVGGFVWWSLLEQRISMWTSLVGPTFGVLMLLGKLPGGVATYLLCALSIKTVQSVMIGVPRGRVSPWYPFLLYYNQTAGALVKIHMSFNLHKQRWTRQNIGQDARGDAGSAPTAGARRVGFLRDFGWVWTVGASAVFLSFVSALVLHDFRPDEARSQGQLERMISEAKAGSTVRVAAGDIKLTRPLIVRRDDVTIAGAGIGKTSLVASFASEGRPTPAMLVVRGETPAEVPPERRATLADPAVPGANALRLTRLLALHPGDIVALREPNTDAFLHELGSQVWNRPFPILRQTMARVARVDGASVHLEQPLGDGFPAGAEVLAVRPRRDVTLRDMTFRYDLDGEPAAGLYANTRPGRGVDGILLSGTDNVVLRDIEVINAGRHPLNIDNSFAPRVSDSRFVGAWNKGPGGNGYVRIARTANGVFDGMTLRGLRHLTIQWSSHDNRFTRLDADSDVNFHGGWSRRNYVSAARLAPRPGHPWPPVVRTPKDARWAPPDGAGNVVLTANGTPVAARLAGNPGVDAIETAETGNAADATAEVDSKDGAVPASPR